MRVFYSFENEESKFVTEIVDAWLYTLDKEHKVTKFCFQDITNVTYKSELVPYDYALIWLRHLVKNGFVNLENLIFKLEEDDE